MLKLTDSGCAQHCPQQITLTGPAAVLVARLILNLPPTDGGPTYICEHGHTHRLTLHQPEEKVTPSLPGRGLAGGTAPFHQPGNQGERKFRSAPQACPEASGAPCP
jgi:hypothetical protein